MQQLKEKREMAGMNHTQLFETSIHKVSLLAIKKRIVSYTECFVSLLFEQFHVKM